LAQTNPASIERVALGITVSTYRRRDRLELLLEHLERYTATPHELVLADDGSRDGTVEWCRANGLRVITGENRGVAHNKNRGLFALATLGCDPILLIEDDVYPDIHGWERDWVAATRLWHHVAYLHPRIARFTTSGGGTPANPYVNYKATAQLLTISAQALDQVGYFDSRFEGWGHEHGEWTTRINRAGYGFKPIELPDGTRTKAQLYLLGGLVDNEGPRWRDPEQGKRNRELQRRISGEPVFRCPWRSTETRSVFLAEQAEGGFDGERLAGELDTRLCTAV
jgi:glycosyltransferase involved in cell wall biosynthesis